MFGEIKDDPINNRAIIGWGLPKIYSELEHASIENAISITAYKRTDINNLDDLINFEFDRVGTIIVSTKLIDTVPYHSYIVITTNKGFKYKSNVTFLYKNHSGYVFNFTATEGTYDINLSMLESF